MKPYTQLGVLTALLVTASVVLADSNLDSPRFSVSNGTVTDNQTGLIWLQNANCFDLKDLTTAMSDAKSLADGACGLSDGSSAGDWRLPNRKELLSLVDSSKVTSSISLPSDHPFLGVQTGYYWASTAYSAYTSAAWFVYISGDYVNYGAKGTGHYVWPVRGGQ